MNYRVSQRNVATHSRQNVATRSRRNVKFRSTALNFECVERFKRSCPRGGCERRRGGWQAEGQKWQVPTLPVSSATWPRELRNQMASRTFRVLEHPAGAHCDFHPPAKPSPSPCNRVTYSNSSDPPALSRILSSIRGVLFPPIIVFPFIAINVNRGTLVYVDIFTIRRYGESRTVMYNGRERGITRNASRGYCFYYYG